MKAKSQGSLSAVNIMVVSAALILIFIAVFSGNSLAQLSSASVIPSLLVLCYIYLTKQSEIFNPISFLLLNLVIGVFLQTVYFSFFDIENHRFGLGRMSDETSLLTGIVCISIAVLGFLIGYSIKRKTKLRRKPHPGYSVKRLRLLCALLAIISIVASLIFAIQFDILTDFINSFSVKRRSYGDDGAIATGGYLRFLSGLSLIAFAFLYLIYKKTPSISILSLVGILMILTGSISILFPIVTSARYGFLHFLVTFATLNHFLTGGWQVSKIARYFVMAMVVILVLSAVRFVQQSGSTFSTFQEQSNTNYALSSIAGSNNLLSIGKTSILIDSVPNSIDYYYGETYLYWLVAPIPRSLWNDKPNVKIGSVLGPTIFGSGLFSGVPPGMVGELFLNFGWFGVVFGMVLIGFLTRKYFDMFGKKSYTNPFCLVVYSLSIPVVAIIFFGGDFTGFMSKLLQVMAPAILIDRLSRRNISR